MCVIPTNLTMIVVPTSHRSRLTMLVAPTSHRLHRSVVVVEEVVVGTWVVVVEGWWQVHCARSLPGLQGVRHFRWMLERE